MSSIGGADTSASSESMRMRIIKKELATLQMLYSNESSTWCVEQVTARMLPDMHLVLLSGFHKRRSRIEK